MNSRLLIFTCLSTLLCNAYANIYNYQLPDNDVVKSLNVTINRTMYKPVIHVYCNNYNSLKHLEIRRGPLSFFDRHALVELTFVGCFNNDTDNENYNYRLWDTISRMPNFAEPGVWSQIDLALDELADVNDDVLLENFNFTKFVNINFANFGFETSRYLRSFKCRYCQFANIKHLDFNDVRTDMTVHHLKIINSEIINLNSENLKKFSTMTVFQMYAFSLADHNAFNVPRLFEHNGQLSLIIFDGSKHKITLHEDVFKGLSELRRLTLTNLQLDYIPENLFIDLHQLQELNLFSNNIKFLHSNTFAKINGLTIRLSDNPIFTMPHDKFESLAVNTYNLYLGNFTQHTLNVVEALVNNHELRNIHFETLLADPIDVTEFTKVHRNRQRNNYMRVDFIGNAVALDMEYIKLHSIAITPPVKQLSDEQEMNVIIRLPVKNSLCTDCWLMKQLTEDYFDNRDFYPEFYFIQSRVLIKPQVSCALEHHLFEKKFKTNCPRNCSCRFNGLLDKVVIDCSNRYLTEIPILEYPEQFDNISAIDLLFENNFLTNLTFENQNPRVLGKLSTLKFRNNNIRSFMIPDALKRALYVLDLCGNDELLNGAANNEFEMASGYFRYEQGQCSKGSQYPRHPALYLKQNKSKTEIDNYLDTFCLTNNDG